MRYSDKLVVNGQNYYFAAASEGGQPGYFFDFTQGTLPNGWQTNGNVTSDGISSNSSTYYEMDENIGNKKVTVEVVSDLNWSDWSDLWVGLYIGDPLYGGSPSYALRCGGLQGYYDPYYKGGLSFIFDDSYTSSNNYLSSTPAGSGSVFENLPAGTYTVGYTYDLSTGDYTCYMKDSNDNYIVNDSGTDAQYIVDISNAFAGQTYYFSIVCAGVVYNNYIKSARIDIS